MSALARLLHSTGLDVQGVDSTPSPTTSGLVRDGIPAGLDAPDASLPDDRDLVIASAAVRHDHPHVLAAAERGIDVLSYPEALGRCMAARTGIAIAGTHGKSTTTAMLGCALTDAGLDPSVIVGATCRQLKSGPLSTPGEGTPTGFRLGAGEIPHGRLEGRPGLLLAEACEFNRSFHNLRPTIAVINSVEADHLDIYASLDEIIEAFAAFARLVPSKADGGVLLIAHDGAHRTKITAGLGCDIRTFGFSPAADFHIEFDPESRRVAVNHDGKRLAQWTNAMPGEHNAMNSATALITGFTAGGDPETLARSLEAFRGLDRRLQYLGKRNHVRVYDDYGHHPTEIDKTLAAIRQADDPARHGGRLICVFQPHQHSRTRFLMEEFATSFSAADIVIVPHIYFVRDSQIEKTKVSAGDLVDRLRQSGVQAMHLYPFEAIAEHLEVVTRPGDLVIVMGAGPVWQVAHQFLGIGEAEESIEPKR